MWRGAVEASRRRGLLRWAGALTLAAAACGIMAWRWHLPSSVRPTEALRAGGEVTPAPAPGLARRGPAAAPDDAEPTEFQGDSTVRLARGGTLTASRDGAGEVTVGSDGVTHIALSAGEVWVQAGPTDARRLVVEHGGWGAWVHGTRFRVRALPEGVEVMVREGDVLLRGPNGGDGVHVRRGELARVERGNALRIVLAVEPEEAVAAATGPRRGADPDEVAEVRRASLALARGDASAALAGYESYLVRHPRGPLAEDAMAGVMDARRSLGDVAGARGAARRYLATFARGVARQRAEEMLSPEN